MCLICDGVHAISHFLRILDLTLGELEQEGLKTLWRDEASNPGHVHEQVGIPRGISIKTVSSALKRLHEKGLLGREKVSHSYVYDVLISRAELQRQLIDSIAAKFADEGRPGLLAAFVDVAEADGEDTLRRLEHMIAARLKGESS